MRDGHGRSAFFALCAYQSTRAYLHSGVKGGASAMTHRAKSFFGGAAIAALLILPAAAANGDWTVWPTKTFNGNAVKLTDIVGTLTVNVRNGGPVTVEVSGTKPRLNGISVHQEDG